MTLLILLKNLCPVAFACHWGIKCECLHISRPLELFELRMPAPVLTVFVFLGEPPDAHCFEAGIDPDTGCSEKILPNWEIRPETFWSAGGCTNHCTTTAPIDTYPDEKFFTLW